MATAPEYFMMNGFNFEKRIINGDIFLRLQYVHVGIISGNKIYFDTNFTHMLGDFSMELWRDTLNYATSIDPNINADLKDQRKNLQDFLTERRAQETQAIMESINYTVYDIYSDTEEEDDLTDYEDFYDTDDEYDEGHFVGNEIPVY
jgi:hypothetical protein